jgi:hypothetical protein
LIYAWLDLQRLEKDEIPEPSSDDIRMFRAILAVVSTISPDAFPGTLEKSLGPVLPSSRNKRRQLIEALAAAGVLTARAERPIKTTHDWNFAEYWRGQDRYNREAVQTLFGKWVTLSQTS